MYHIPNVPVILWGSTEMATMLRRAKEIRGALLEAVERIANPQDFLGELQRLISVKRPGLFLLSLLVLPYSTLANAAVDATGSFSGSITHSATTCAGGYSDPTQTESATLTFTQSGASFSGSGSVGNSTFTSLSGSISATGSITGASFNMTDSSGPGGSGTFTGSLSGETVTLSGFWTDSGYPGTNCTGTFSGSLTRGGAIVSASSPSSTATAPMLLSTQVNAVTTAIGTRIGDALRGVATGPRKIASGFMWEGQSGLNAGDGIDCATSFL